MTAIALHTRPTRPATSQPRPVRSSQPARSSQPRMRVHAIQTPRARVRRTVLLVAAIALLALFGPRAIAGDEPTAPVLFDTYTVASGETLWSIAASMTAPGEDVREVLQDIKTLNAMSSGSVMAGEQILIPEIG